MGACVATWDKPSLSFLSAPSIATSNAYSKCLIMGTNKTNLSLVQACSELFQNVVEKALADQRERTPEGLDETERANFRRRRDKLLAKAEAERNMFVNEDDNYSDSSNEGSVDGIEKEACTMYVDLDQISTNFRQVRRDKA